MDYFGYSASHSIGLCRGNNVSRWKKRKLNDDFTWGMWLNTTPKATTVSATKTVTAATEPVALQ
ncbi:hypothetical protein [Vibrio sp.]|uniref:hypothetical protein n=1 Tax=Vibrio sp. TaxID=678 RepID=UPI003AA8C1BE